MWGLRGRIVATVLFLGMWFLMPFGLPLSIYLLLSAAYGYVVSRWWAPVGIFLVFMAVVAFSVGLDDDADASNVPFAIFAGVILAAVVAVGVLLARFTSWLRGRGSHRLHGF